MSTDSGCFFMTHMAWPPKKLTFLMSAGYLYLCITYIVII